MNFKQILGLLAIVVGIALVIFEIYGKQKILVAKGEISNAKQKVGQGDQLFSLNPISKEVGKRVTDRANKKIGEAEHTVEYYENLFKWCQIGGIALIVIGGGLVVLCRTRRIR